MVSLCHWNRCFLAACFFVGISGNDIFVAIFFCKDNEYVLLLLSLPEWICFPRSTAVRWRLFRCPCRAAARAATPRWQDATDVGHLPFDVVNPCGFYYIIRPYLNQKKYALYIYIYYLNINIYVTVHGYKYEIQILSARSINRYMLEDSNWEWFNWWTKSGRPMVVFLTSWWPRWQNFFHQQYEMKWWIVRTVRKGKAYATSWFLIIALAFPFLEWGLGFTGLCISVFVMGEYQCRFPNYQPKLAVSSKAVTFSPQTNQMKDGYSMILGQR